MTIAKHVMENGKRYYPCTHRAETHPSITTYLDVIGSTALMGWSAKMGTKKLLMFAKQVELLSTEEVFKAAKELVEKQWFNLGEKSDFWKKGAENAKDAADHGTMAHAAFEMFLKGKEVDIKSLSPEAANAFTVFMNFASSNQLETSDTEKTFYNCKMDYACTTDWKGKLNGKTTLGDWKTSTGIFEKNVVQCWANAIADEMEHGDILYEQILVGRFGKDGTTDLLIVPRRGLEGGFLGYEQARTLIQGLVPWFHFKQKWEEKFPYIKKK